MGAPIENPEPHAPDRERAARVVNAMRERGVLISPCGRDQSIPKIRPPPVFGTDHADLFLRVLDEAPTEA